MINKIRQLFSGFSSSRSGDGIRVTGRANGFLTLELLQGAAKQMRAVPVTSPVRATCHLDGVRSVLRVEFAEGDPWEFSPGQEQSCRESYEALMRSISRKPRPWWHLGMITLAALIVLFILVPADVGGQGSPAGAGQQDGQVFRDPSVAAVPASSTLDPVELAQVRAVGGIELRKAGTPFYVFSDPGCPFCVELERSFVKLHESLNPVVIPVAFKPGSRELAAAALCSKEAPAAWTKTLLEGKSEGEVCEKGLAAVDANNELFRRLSLSSTPTMISPKGLVVIGSGSPEKIHEVMSQ